MYFFFQSGNPAACEVLMLNEAVFWKHMLRDFFSGSSDGALFIWTLCLKFRALVWFVLLCFSSDYFFATAEGTINYCLRTNFLVFFFFWLHHHCLTINAFGLSASAGFFMSFELFSGNHFLTKGMRTTKHGQLALFMEVNFHLLQRSFPNASFISSCAKHFHLVDELQGNQVWSKALFF